MGCTDGHWSVVGQSDVGQSVQFVTDRPQTYLVPHWIDGLLACWTSVWHWSIRTDRCRTAWYLPGSLDIFTGLTRIEQLGLGVRRVEQLVGGWWWSMYPSGMLGGCTSSRYTLLGCTSAAPGVSVALAAVTETALPPWDLSLDRVRLSVGQEVGPI